MALNTKTSIVDYLKSQKQDSSYGSRSKLAQSNGIKNYQGTARQNAQLLGALQKAKPIQQAKKTTKAQPKAQPRVNSALDQAGLDVTSTTDNYKNFLKDATDASYNNQQSMLEQTKNNNLTNLEKALGDANFEGEQGQKEAEKALVAEQGAINEDAYMNSQATNLSGENRGVQNSQQMLAMQQGDQRHASGLSSDARTQRDERIGGIKDRLAQIQNNYNLDVTSANKNYDTGLQGARAQSDMQFAQGMSQMQMEQMKTALQTKANLTIEEQRQLNQLEQMDKQQGFTEKNMDTQFKMDLKKMKTSYGYDVKKIDKQFGNDLAKMAKQQGYDLNKISRQNANAMSQISASRNAAMAKANAEKANAENSLKNSYLKPGSWEYRVRNKQIEESQDNAYDQAYNKAIGEAKGVIEAENMNKPTLNYTPKTSTSGRSFSSWLNNGSATSKYSPTTSGSRFSR